MDTPRILIVGSDAAFVEETSDVLGNSYSVESACSREEGFKRARESLPEMVIIGFLEPRGDSFKFYKELRGDSVTQDISLLVIDVRPEEHLRKGWRKDHGMQLNAEGYLTQPVDPDELRRAITGIIGRAAAGKQGDMKTVEQAHSVLEQMEQIEKGLGK